MIKRLKAVRARIVRQKKLLSIPELLVPRLLILGSGLMSTSVGAHPGHLVEEAMHSMLHLEHVIGFAVLAIFTFVVMALWKK